MHHISALVYCNILKEFRLGGWGIEGPKSLTLGQYIRVCAPLSIQEEGFSDILQLGQNTTHKKDKKTKRHNTNSDKIQKDRIQIRQNTNRTKCKSNIIQKDNSQI